MILLSINSLILLLKQRWVQLASFLKSVSDCFFEHLELLKVDRSSQSPFELDAIAERDLQALGVLNAPVVTKHVSPFRVDAFLYVSWGRTCEKFGSASRTLFIVVVTAIDAMKPAGVSAADEAAETFEHHSLLRFGKPQRQVEGSEWNGTSEVNLSNKHDGRYLSEGQQ